MDATMPTLTKRTYSRRAVLKRTGALIVAFSLTAQRRPAVAWAAAGSTDARSPLTPDQLDSWLAVSEDGRVTVYSGKIDMGTGTRTAFGQIVAEELDVPFASVEVVMGDTALTPDERSSTASRGIVQGGGALRQAAADARQILLELAADHLGVPVERLVVTDGVVADRDDASARVSYGELIGGRPFDAELTVVGTTPWGPIVAGKATPKDPGQYTIVGTPVPRVDIPAKVTGEYVYAQNVRVDGMLHGRVVRPPAFGAELISLDESSVQHVPGVRVVRDGDFVGVVAEREEDAIRAARDLEVEWSDALQVRWSDTAGLPDYDNLYPALRSAPVIERAVVVDGEPRPADQDDGEAELSAVFEHATHSLAATYEFPFQLHGMIGPTCAVADVQGDRATIWSGTQGPAQTRTDVAQMLGLPVENVRVVWVEESGAYGRLAAADAAADAALMSRAVGAPVRVQWMRHDEHGWEPVSPPMVMDLRAGLDDQGNIVGWRFEQWSSTHLAALSGNLLAWRLVGTAPGWERSGGGVIGDGRHPYAFEHDHRITNAVEPMIRTLFIRSPGGVQNTFAIESFMDELATVVGADPVEFRLRHLEDPRAIAVLERVAEMAGWSAGRSRPSGDGPDVAVGRGVAVASYGTDSRVAMVADVEVDKTTGRVRVQKVFVAHDCGLIINPAGVRHQVHGNVIQMTSRTLLEEVKFDRSRIMSLDWEAYPILAFRDVPDIEVELIDRPDIPASSVGEVATTPVAAAIGNAVHDATGVRLRRIPFTPERVLAALA